MPPVLSIPDNKSASVSAASNKEDLGFTILLAPRTAIPCQELEMPFLECTSNSLNNTASRGDEQGFSMPRFVSLLVSLAIAHYMESWFLVCENSLMFFVGLCECLTVLFFFIYTFFYSIHGARTIMCFFCVFYLRHINIYNTCQRNVFFLPKQDFFMEV